LKEVRPAVSLKDLLVPHITFNQLEPVIRQITEASRYISMIPKTCYLPKDFQVIRGPPILSREKPHCRDRGEWRRKMSYDPFDLALATSAAVVGGVLS